MPTTTPGSRAPSGRTRRRRGRGVRGETPWSSPGPRGPHEVYDIYSLLPYLRLFDGFQDGACSIIDKWPTLGRDMFTEGMVVGTIIKPELNQDTLQDYGCYSHQS